MKAPLRCRHGGTYKALCTCLKHKLLHHDNSKYDGYRLTTLGYDFLAINTLRKRGAIASVGAPDRRRQRVGPLRGS